MDGEEYVGYGADMIDTQAPDIPFTNEQFRYFATITHTSFVEHTARRIENMRISRAAKRALTDVLKTFFNESVVLAHHKTVEDATSEFDLMMYHAKATFAPHDVTQAEFGALCAAMRAHYRILITRTVGGENTRERILQHGSVVEQRIKQTTEQIQPEKKKGIFGI